MGDDAVEFGSEVGSLGFVDDSVGVAAKSDFFDEPPVLKEVGIVEAPIFS